MKTAIIIGANSFIARNLIKYINLTKDIEIIGVYDFSEKHFDGIENYHQIRITSKESVSTINMNCDIIFFFVGKTGTMSGFDDYEDFININELSLLNILNEYKKQKSKAKIIYPSTRLVYKGSEVPIKENGEKDFRTIYAINKYACEYYLMQYNTMFDVSYCIFRICVPYGSMIKDVGSYGTAEFMLKKAVNGENICIYGDGKQRRTLTHIYNLCSIMCEGAISENCKNDIYNIGGEEYSLKEMAELIAQKYHVSVEYLDWPENAIKIESGSTVFDDSKLRSVLKMSEQKYFINWINEKLEK